MRRVYINAKWREREGERREERYETKRRDKRNQSAWPQSRATRVFHIKVRLRPEDSLIDRVTPTYALIATTQPLPCVPSGVAISLRSNIHIPYICIYIIPATRVDFILFSASLDPQRNVDDNLRINNLEIGNYATGK